LVQFNADPSTAPAGWKAAGPEYIATSPGRLLNTVELPADTNYTLWLLGSFGRPVQVIVDGRTVKTVRWEESYPGAWDALATVRLRKGNHRVELLRGGGGLLPGTGSDIGSAQTLGAIGPILFDPRASTPIRTVGAKQAAAVCRNAKGLD